MIQFLPFSLWEVDVCEKGRLPDAHGEPQLRFEGEDWLEKLRHFTTDFGVEGRRLLYVGSEFLTTMFNVTPLEERRRRAGGVLGCFSSCIYRWMTPIYRLRTPMACLFFQVLPCFCMTIVVEV